jgi:trehalose 2-sulfotransferase
MLSGAKAARTGSRGTQAKPADDNAPSLIDSWYDFPDQVPLRKSYVIASTPRCGSTFLSTVLWQTGVLGAPSEYWNYHKRAAVKTIGTKMMERLEALSRADYLTKLLACRTSKNGVFGVKVHYNDFEEAIRRFPELLDLVAPTKFIYIERLDKVAQAVSMARAVQTGVYASWRKGRDGPSAANLRYDRELIANFLVKLEEQNLNWKRWFEDNKIDPFVVSYESLAADQAAVAGSVMKLLDVENDEPQPVRYRPLSRQGDSINKEWIARYKSEPAVDANRSSGAAGTAGAVGLLDAIDAEPRTGEAHIFDHFDRLKRSVVEAKSPKSAYLVGVRLRHRYKAIVMQNRDLFRDARVLDVQSGDGRWSFAAIDAGARHVVGIESRRRPVEIADGVFAKYGVKRGAYQFIHVAPLIGLNDFSPGQFDLVLCQDTADLSDPYFFFEQLLRLRPKHIILDTALNSRLRAVATFKLTFKAKGRDKPTVDATRGKFVSITCIPNHELVARLCEHFEFRCQAVDWKRLGIVDWAGLGDYEQRQRRTYVLRRT